MTRLNRMISGRVPRIVTTRTGSGRSRSHVRVHVEDVVRVQTRLSAANRASFASPKIRRVSSGPASELPFA